MSCCTSVSPVSTTCSGGSSIPYNPFSICIEGTFSTNFHKIPPSTDCSSFEDSCKCEDCPSSCNTIITNNTTSSYSWSWNALYCYYSCATTYILSCKYCIPIYRECPTTSPPPPPPPPGDCEGGGG